MTEARLATDTLGVKGFLGSEKSAADGPAVAGGGGWGSGVRVGGGVQRRFRGAGDTDNSDQGVSLGVTDISNGLGLPRRDMTTGWYRLEGRHRGAGGPTVTICVQISG